MIELCQLTKRFSPRGDGVKSVLAVDSVSFEVAAGELLVLLGGSGSGKSTTLKMINKLIEPTSGTIRLFEKNTNTLRPYELRRQVGYVIQRIGLFPHMTVFENIAVTPTLLGWSQLTIKTRVDELLKLVELEPSVFKDRFPSELSGGQQQRVGVARALAARPRVMLLDEPFGALDAATRSTLQKRFQEIRKDLGIGGIFVTHDLVEALSLADRIGIMRDGRLIQLDSPANILTNPADDGVRSLIEAPLDYLRNLRQHLSLDTDPGAST